MVDRHRGQAGFTLIETLAALAISSMIIVAAGQLLHQGVFFFDRGARTVDQNEQLALAIDSLSGDFGAARFVLDKTASKAQQKTVSKVAFTGLPASEGGQAKILFITSGGRAAGPQGEEVVSLTAEAGDGIAQLVRRRTAWLGPRIGLDDAVPGDPVILLKGKYDISFSFSELTKDGHLIWHDRWTGETGLPHSVRLNLRDSETSADLLAGAEFPIHADAPPACAGGDKTCLSLANASTAPAAPPAGQTK